MAVKSKTKTETYGVVYVLPSSKNGGGNDVRRDRLDRTSEVSDSTTGKESKQSERKPIFKKSPAKKKRVGWIGEGIATEQLEGQRLQIGTGNQQSPQSKNCDSRTRKKSIFR